MINGIEARTSRDATLAQSARTGYTYTPNKLIPFITNSSGVKWESILFARRVSVYHLVFHLYTQISTPYIYDFFFFNLVTFFFLKDEISITIGSISYLVIDFTRIHLTRGGFHLLIYVFFKRGLICSLFFSLYLNIPFD